MVRWHSIHANLWPRVDFIVLWYDWFGGRGICQCLIQCQANCVTGATCDFRIIRAYIVDYVIDYVCYYCFIVRLGLL